MSKKHFVWSILILFLSGCAAPRASREAMYLSNEYDAQVQKNIIVVSVIDARPDKNGDTQKLLSNRPSLDQFVLNPLRVKKYNPKFLSLDTSVCGSLVGTNNISEVPCIENKLPENGDLFLLISIDQFIPPKGAGIIGETKITGVLYSKSSDSFLWKDTIEGSYGSGYLMFGPGGYTGMLLVKAMGKDYNFRYNAFCGVQELLNSMPPFPNARRSR